jgi:hypothetical protein
MVGKIFSLRDRGIEADCEIMMKRLTLLLVLCAALAGTSAARSQQPDTTSASAKNNRHHQDSVEFTPSPELRKSLENLAASVQALANRIASDPKIRSDAIRVASGLVATAQQVVTEQSVVLEGALKSAADKIGAAQSANSRPPRAPR